MLLIITDWYSNSHSSCCMATKVSSRVRANYWNEQCNCFMFQTLVMFNFDNDVRKANKAIKSLWFQIHCSSLV